MKRHHWQIRTIDHEPLSAGSEHTPADSGHRLAESGGAGRFQDRLHKPDFSGQRRKTSAVTGDFFAARRSELQDGAKSGTQEAAMAAGDLSTSVPLTRTIAGVVAVFTLAVTIPTGFIAMTENLEQAAIDPMTTASINPPAGQGQLAVTDVSMTRIMKSGSSVVTVFGEIRNAAGESQTPGDVVIQLLDENGRIVQSWQHRTGAGGIKPDGKLRFITSSIDISGRARTVVAFTKPVAVANPSTSAFR